MIYLTDTEQIKNSILDLIDTEILWLDTEVADYKTKKPRLSLIQVLAYPDNLDGDRTYIFDVLDNDDLISFFIEKIMNNERIIKVFHNAKYDLRLLGKKQTENVFCTLECARKIPFYLLPVTKYSLKVLTEYLTQFKELDKEEQGSDWGVRPLSEKQLDYAKMDCVYLAQVYHKLIELKHQCSYNPQQENIDNLSARYQEIENRWRYLDSEKEELEKRIKEAMLAQNKQENPVLKLTSYQRKTVTTKISEIIKLANDRNLNLDFTINLTKDIQSQLESIIDELNTEVETKTVYSLKSNLP